MCCSETVSEKLKHDFPKSSNSWKVKAFGDEGLYYFNARWYDPQLGRFITEDPIKDGLNWFAYVNNNPLNYIDPTGLKYTKADEQSLHPEETPIFKWPVDSGRVTSAFGLRDRVRYRAADGTMKRTGPFHTGLDFGPAIRGDLTPLTAMDSGRVSKIGYDDVKGFYTEIDHLNGYGSKIFHYDIEPVLKEGADVTEDTILGFMGNTGASTGVHGHVMITKDGQNIDPSSVMEQRPQSITLEKGVVPRADGSLFNATESYRSSLGTRLERAECAD